MNAKHEEPTRGKKSNEGNGSKVNGRVSNLHSFGDGGGDAMRLPVISGLIRRRVLVNFRVDEAVMRRFLPSPFRPKVHRGHAIAGICLIRLEQIRPGWLPGWCGITSENAAHRVGVLWDEPSGGSREGVFIPRRDTGSWLNHLGCGHLFPGEHHFANFTVADDGSRIAMAARSRDGFMSVQLRAVANDSLPESSCFESLAEASAYFEGGSVGYSVTRDGCRLDGVRLQTDGMGRLGRSRNGGQPQDSTPTEGGLGDLVGTVVVGFEGP